MNIHMDIQEQKNLGAVFWRGKLPAPRAWISGQLEACPRTGWQEKRASSWEHSWWPGKLGADGTGAMVSAGSGVGSALFRMLRAEPGDYRLCEQQRWATAPAALDALLALIIPLPGDESSSLCFPFLSGVWSTRKTERQQMGLCQPGHKPLGTHSPWHSPMKTASEGSSSKCLNEEMSPSLC